MVAHAGNVAVVEWDDVGIVDIDGTGGIDCEGIASVRRGMDVICGIHGIDCASTRSVQTLRRKRHKRCRDLMVSMYRAIKLVNSLLL